MAFKFNAILDFNSNKAIAGMKKANTAFGKFSAGMKKAGAQINTVGIGLGSVAAVTAPFTLGIASAIKSAADFEAQISTVQGVLLATKQEMGPIIAETKRLGATTVFTAVQAGEAAETLARAGLTIDETADALEGVLNAAAASGIGMAEATNIVVGQLKSFGLQASESGRVADTLALTTALTNTNMVELGEGMKLVSGEARALGLTVEETATAVGILANAGIKGTLAGTALRNAFNKLSKPSKKVLEIFGGRDGFTNLAIDKVTKKILPLEVIMSNLAQATQRAKDPLDATMIGTELLGIRGKVALNAFKGQMAETVTVTSKNLKLFQEGVKRSRNAINETFVIEVGKAIPKLTALRLQMLGAQGVSKQMASIMLNNLKGGAVLFSSALEGLKIEFGELFLKDFKRGTDTAGQFLSVLALAFRAVKSGTMDTKEMQKALELGGNQFADSLPEFLAFAEGFLEGFKEVREVAKSVFKAIVNFIKNVSGQSSFTAKDLGKIVAKIVLIGAVLAPVAAAMAAFLLILPPMIAGVVAAFGLLKGAIIIIGKVIGLVLLPIFVIGSLISGITEGIMNLVRNLGNVIGAFREGFGSGVLKIIKTFTAGFMQGVVGPLDLVIGKVKSFFSLFDDTPDATNQFGVTPNSQLPSQFRPENIINEQVNKTVIEQVKRKVISTPPSAEENAQAVAEPLRGALRSAGQQQVNVQTRLTGELTARIAGSDILIGLTKAKVENTQRNGGTIENGKRRLMQNGEFIEQVS